MLYTMAGFDKLPTEIIVMILDHVDDFYGLDSLLQNSYRVAMVFQADSVRITEHLIHTCPVTKPFPSTIPIDDSGQRIHQNEPRRFSEFDCDVYRFFRELAYIRTPSFRSKCPELSLSALKSISSTQCLSVHFRGRSPSETSYVLRGMIKVAAQIQRLACACLHLMSSNLKQATSNAPNFHIRRSHAAFGPPSWIEELRVYRALWILQIYSDLHAAVRSTVWNLEYAWVLEGYAYKRRIPTGIVKEVISVYEVLKDVVSLPHPMIPPGFPTPHFTYDDYLPFLLSLELKENISFPIWSPPPVPSVDDEVNSSWFLSPYYRHVSTERIQDFEKLPRPGVGVIFGTSKEDMDSFKILGVYIWDPWRYYSAGLMEPPIESRLTPDGDYSTYSDEASDKETRSKELFSLIDSHKKELSRSAGKRPVKSFPIFAVPLPEENTRIHKSTKRYYLSEFCRPYFG